ncbi:MAG: Trm112 family protein [Planctomycetota bacterium]
MDVDEALLSLLVCPACREPVEPYEGVLRCKGCGRGYPVRDGIPVMLIDEALLPEQGQPTSEDKPPEAPSEGH